MKKVIIGGFLSLIGTLGEISVFITAANNMACGWCTPPGRCLTTVLEIGMAPVLACNSLILAIGLVIMGKEYFKKEDQTAI